MNHLYVLGGHNKPDHVADEDMAIAHSRARRHRHDHRVIAARCNSGRALIAEAKNAFDHFGSPIDLLDIYYHGGDGTMYIGRNGNHLDCLFQSDESLRRLTGWNWAEQLARYLSPTAHVRLLGCETALGVAGRMLVYKLGVELGQRRVAFGCLADVLLAQFHPESGLFACDHYLFSSHASLDGIAPSLDHREIARPRRYPTGG
jgi:hypothetical protein